MAGRTRGGGGYPGYLGSTYFELLLCDVAAVGLEELQHVGDEVAAAEVVGSQRGEENPLGPATHLAGETADEEVNTSVRAGGGLALSATLRRVAECVFVKRTAVLMPHLAVGAGGEPQQILHEVLVNAPVLAAFHRQLT